MAEHRVLQEVRQISRPGYKRRKNYIFQLDVIRRQVVTPRLFLSLVMSEDILLLEVSIQTQILGLNSVGAEKCLLMLLIYLTPWDLFSSKYCTRLPITFCICGSTLQYLMQLRLGTNTGTVHVMSGFAG